MNYGVIKFLDNFNVAGYMNLVYWKLYDIPPASKRKNYKLLKTNDNYEHAKL